MNSPPPHSHPPHILFFVTEDWAFCSHRLPVARAARDAGMRVTVVTQVSTCAAQIAAEGFALEPIRLRRAGLNPLAELHLLWQLRRVYRRVRPDLVHHVTIKPVVYGSLVAWWLGVPCVVNALTGLGFVFSSGTRLGNVLKPMLKTMFRWAFAQKNSRLILQNPDDQALFVSTGLVAAAQVRLILGSGVDVDVFVPTPEPEGIPVVVLPARLLRDKGVYEFVEAARLLKARGVTARFALVGEPDAENPAAVSALECAQWVQEGLIEAWGWRRDMAQVMAEANIVCLPSYREGLPKCLLEAASCGRAIVTTDVPGCREVVDEGVNGLLVPLRSTGPLADALERLLCDAPLRRRFGAAGRHRVLERYAQTLVAEQTVAVYQELLGLRAAHLPEALP